MRPGEYRGWLTAGFLWLLSITGVAVLGVLSVGNDWAPEYSASLAVAAFLLLLQVQDVATRVRPDDPDSRIPTAPGTVWTLSVGGKLMQLTPVVIMALALFGFGMWASGRDQPASQERRAGGLVVVAVICLILTLVELCRARRLEFDGRYYRMRAQRHHVRFTTDALHASDMRTLTGWCVTAEILTTDAYGRPVWIPSRIEVPARGWNFDKEGTPFADEDTAAATRQPPRNLPGTGPQHAASDARNGGPLPTNWWDE